jgi:hypothetical protein
MPWARMHCEYANARSRTEPVGDEVPLGLAAPTLATPGPPEPDEQPVLTSTATSSAANISPYRLMDRLRRSIRVDVGSRSTGVSRRYQQLLLKR